MNLGNVGSTTAYNNGYLVYGGTGNNNYGTDLGFNNGRYSTRLFAPNSADITFGAIPSLTLPTLQSQFSTLMTIRGDTGNVGIGTATPGARLEVAGTVKIVDGSQGAGKVLTSDASGLATWTTNNYSETDPIWLAQKSLYATLLSPTFTGTPTLPTGTIAVTQTAGNSTTAIATTAFVTTADALKADIASPSLTGTPTAPTAAAATNTTQIATTAFVKAQGYLTGYTELDPEV